MARQGLAVRREPDPDQRKNVILAIAIFATVVGVAVASALLRRAATVVLEVEVRGYEDVPLRTFVEVSEGTNAGGKVVAKGETDPSTARVALRVPPGGYLVKASVFVKETDVGLPNEYPQYANVAVPEDAAGPVKVALRFPSVEPYWEKPGQFRIRK